MDQTTSQLPKELLTDPLDFIQSDFQTFLTTPNKENQNISIIKRSAQYAKDGNLASMVQDNLEDLLSSQEIPLVNNVKTYKEL